ncbi:hypothetical protein FOZ62_019941 [Perkinsus olseni]|uniref:Reverse transcriptase RNase H-like domain-containing protein n=1 Tax=Perkinsus olseni TaxID=32597 RepID=A0A7J6RWD3_PEROL|nr:hypothetical protein FOZ62_019941 [Perkinsus olseni]
MADDDEEAPISVNIAASIPFPRDEKTFKTLEMLPDDLYKVRQWGLSQNQTESNQIAMTGAMLPPDLSRQLELEGDVSLLPRWDAFRRRRLLSAKELIGQGTLYHARRTIKKGSSETLREFWGRVRCLTEINDPCLSTDDINRRTAEQFALGLPNDLQLPLMEKINEKGTMSPAEVLALVDRKERRHRITKTLYVMKRSREESTSDEEDEDGPPPDKRTRSSRESSRPAGKGKGGKGKGRSRDAEDRDHHHNEGAIRQLSQNVRRIMAQTRPKDVKALRRFLGMTGFYRRFIKGYTDIAKPLTQLLGAKVPFHWGREEQDSYDTLVQSLQEDPVLITPDWNKGFILETDASKYAIGGVLMQSDSQGRYHIICYGSKKLTPAQQRWSAVEREIYAGVHFLQAYRYYLDSGVVALRTDSKPFSYIVRQRDITGRFSHWLAILQSFGGLTVEYKTGPSNVVADYLSRDVAAIAVSPVQAWRFDQLEDLKRAQKEDEELCHWFRKGTKPSGTSYESLRK